MNQKQSVLKMREERLRDAAGFHLHTWYGTDLDVALRLKGERT